MTTIDVPEVTIFYVQTPPTCVCVGYEGTVRIVHIMSPINDLARNMDANFERDMTLWQLREKARRCMVEVNW